MLNRLLTLLAALLTISAGCCPRPPSTQPEDLPPPFSPQALNFIVVGDWGRDVFVLVARHRGLLAYDPYFTEHP